MNLVNVSSAVCSPFSALPKDLVRRGQEYGQSSKGRGSESSQLPVLNPA